MQAMVGADELRQMIRSDYAEGRVLLVDGWLISQTEYTLLLRAGIA
jgi:hypothetical protein